MKFQAKIQNNELAFYDVAKIEDFLSKHDGEQITITIEDKKRTDRQNNSLHLYFQLLADELNAGGFDMRKVIREGIDIPWSAYNVKEQLWRPVQEAQLGKESTTKLTTKEIDVIYDTVNRVIAERTGVHVAFPSIENINY